MGRGTKQFEIPMVTINNSSINFGTIIPKYVDTNTNLINSINTAYIMAEMFGFKVAAEAVNQAVEDGKYILHSDSQPYLFSDIQKEN